MLVLAEEVDVVALVPPTKAGMWHVLLLLVLLLQLWLLVDRRREMRERIREVMPRKAAAVACHCSMCEVLPLGSSCAMLLPGYGHAIDGVESAGGLWAKVASNRRRFSVRSASCRYL